MKIKCLNLVGGFLSRAYLFAAFVCIVVFASPSAWGAQEAKVTKIIKDVNVLGANKAARPANLNEQVGPGAGVRTGAASRAELTFSDLSITRLGENTVFSVNAAGRTIQLGSGAVLVEAPPNSAAIHVNTAAFSAAVSGGTGIIEFHLGGISKLVTLEGQTAVTPNGGVVFILPAGEMVTMTPDGKFSAPVKVDISKIMGSSHLITDFDTLPNAQLIYEIIQAQLASLDRTGINQPPHDNIDEVVTRDDASPPGGEQGGGSGPPPPPFPVITSPDPYIITSGTTITTDPTITTNGQTDQGVIYHGSAIDGPLSAFIFGSTSGFDAVSGFDTELTGDMAAAGFKFKNLLITGDPTIDTTNGPINLGLIALGNITTGAPGGPITFSGIRGVLLAAQDGSITLGPDVSFSIDHDFNAYARGDNGDLTVQSNITAGEHVDLFAQRDMSISSTISTDQFYSFNGRNLTITGTDTIQAPTITISSLGDITWDGETSDTGTGNGDGSVTIQALNNLNVAGDLSFTRHSNGNDEGVNLTLIAANGAATIQGSLNLVVDNSSGGTIGTGGNIDLESGGDLTVNGEGGITLTVSNTDGGFITEGGNINVNVGGRLNAPSLNALIDNSVGSIGGDANVSVTVTGNGGVNLPGQAEFKIDNSLPSTAAPRPAEATIGIGGSAAIEIDVQHGDFVTQTGLDATIDNTGNTIGGSVDILATFANALTVNSHPSGAANFSIANASGTMGNANISVMAGSVSTGFFLAQIDNSDGTLNGGANVTLNVTGGVTATDSETGVSLFVFNEGGVMSGSNTQGIHYTAGGTTTTPLLQLYFDNANGGSVGQGANLTIDATGPVVLNGALGAEVDNFNGGSITTGGNVTAHFHNDVGDTAGPHHSLNFFVINGGDDGSFIGNLVGGSIGTGGNITVNFDGNANTMPMGRNGAIAVEIANGTGSIGAGGNISVTAGTASGGGDVTGSLVTLFIANTNGVITNGANITFVAKGLVKSTDFTDFFVDNRGGTIGNIPEINVHVGSFDVATYLTAEYDNEGGSIGPGGTGDGIVSIMSDGDVTVGATLSILGSLTSGGIVTAQTVASSDVTAATAIHAGTGGIQQFTYLENGTIPLVTHTLDAPIITSTGGIYFNGPGSDGDSPGQDGGTLILQGLNSISFDSEGDIRGSVTLNGGDAQFEAPPGSGGSLTVNASSNITVNSDIEATTGYQDANAQPQGNGGLVTLHSTGGLVTVNSRIEVSSDDPTPEQSPPPPIRRSATGGNITLQSDLTTGQGITVGSNAQLLSLLDPEAAGPGGTITLSTKGSNITVSPGATIKAEGSDGIIIVDQNDPAGPSIPTITIDGATLTSEVISINGAGVINIGQTNAATINTSELDLLISNQLGFDATATQGGTIAGDSAINWKAPSLSTNFLVVELFNENDLGGAGTAGGHINGSASITLSATDGALSVTAVNPDSEPGALDVFIDNYGVGDGSAGGFIGSNASIAVTATSIHADGDASFSIDNSGGGTIGGSASINVSAGSASIGELEGVSIFNDNFTGGDGSLAGHITGAASITFNITGALNVSGSDNDGDDPGTTRFTIENSGVGDGSPAGYIGSNASIDVSAGSIMDSGNGLRIDIFNSNGGTIGGNASITLTTGSLTSAPVLDGSATTGDITTASLTAQIDNTDGTINGAATIDMNVSGDVDVTNDVTVQILGNDAVEGAAINFNGGNYNVGGTFTSTIAGNGTLTFNNANVSANVLKAGVFGDSGMLKIGGGTLSANTVLKLYAPGSSGVLEFVSNVILSSGTAMDLVANTITIDPGKTVSIEGAGGAANIYTNNANYAWGDGQGNQTNGSFGGSNGAKDPKPIDSNTPGFDDTTMSPSSGSTKSSGSKPATTTRPTVASRVPVTSSGQLISMVNDAGAGVNSTGRVASNSKGNRRSGSKGAGQTATKNQAIRTSATTTTRSSTTQQTTRLQ